MGWDPERLRPPRAVRARGLRLSWPEGPLRLTLGGLRDLQVRLSRDGSDRLAWDQDDSRFVVGWVLDAVTEKALPYQEMQGFGGLGPDIDADAADVWLPVRWITDDLDSLAPGPYRLAVALTSMRVQKTTVDVGLVAD